jgi:ribosomal protein L11 methyltransferase
MRRFARIELRACDVEAAERAAAEAYDAGAVGLEERDGGATLVLYAPAAAAEAVRAALAASLGSEGSVGLPEPVEPADWTERWKAGIGPVEVSPRLVVRPSFSPPAASGRAELVIDPGQAFGTGSHLSTRLALEWVVELAPRLPAAARVLDVGSGSGVLALAALRLGPARAVACDLDPVAAAATRANARRNALAERLETFVGSVHALRPVGFDLVLANLLRSELLPLVAAIAAQTAPGGRVVLSGLLEGERDALEPALAAAGLRSAGIRRGRDASGDVWIALLTTR